YESHSLGVRTAAWLVGSAGTRLCARNFRGAAAMQAVDTRGPLCPRMPQQRGTGFLQIGGQFDLRGVFGLGRLQSRPQPRSSCEVGDAEPLADEIRPTLPFPLDAVERRGDRGTVLFCVRVADLVAEPIERRENAEQRVQFLISLWHAGRQDA